MNPTALSRAILEGIRSTLGKAVNVEAEQQKQYLSVKANRKLLVLLYNKCKAHVTVSKLTISDRGNQTCRKIMRVQSEIDIPRAVEKIARIYSEKKLS